MHSCNFKERNKLHQEALAVASAFKGKVKKLNLGESKLKHETLSQRQKNNLKKLGTGTRGNFTPGNKR